MPEDPSAAIFTVVLISTQISQFDQPTEFEPLFNAEAGAEIAITLEAWNPRKTLILKVERVLVED